MRSERWNYYYSRRTHQQMLAAGMRDLRRPVIQRKRSPTAAMAAAARMRVDSKVTPIFSPSGVSVGAWVG